MRCIGYHYVVDYFNSIKVRLNQFQLYCSVRQSEFQFHKGTIKPKDWFLDCYSSKEFQFHKGTIKPSCMIRFPPLSIISIP